MSTNRDFVTPIFRGGRFEDAVLSVDVLADLAAYRDLVVELASEAVAPDLPASVRPALHPQAGRRSAHTATQDARFFISASSHGSGTHRNWWHRQRGASSLAQAL